MATICYKKAGDTNLFIWPKWFIRHCGIQAALAHQIPRQYATLIQPPHYYGQFPLSLGNETPTFALYSIHLIWTPVNTDSVQRSSVRQPGASGSRYWASKTVFNLPDNRRRVKSILLDEKLLGLVEMTSGLVNASFRLPEWQAVKMIFFPP